MAFPFCRIADVPLKEKEIVIQDSLVTTKVKNIKVRKTWYRDGALEIRPDYQDTTYTYFNPSGRTDSLKVAYAENGNRNYACDAMRFDYDLRDSMIRSVCFEYDAFSDKIIDSLVVEYIRDTSSILLETIHPIPKHPSLSNSVFYTHDQQGRLILKEKKKHKNNVVTERVELEYIDSLNAKIRKRTVFKNSGIKMFSWIDTTYWNAQNKVVKKINWTDNKNTKYIRLPKCANCIAEYFYNDAGQVDKIIKYDSATSDTLAQSLYVYENEDVVEGVNLILSKRV